MKQVVLFIIITLVLIGILVWSNRTINEEPEEESDEFKSDQAELLELSEKDQEWINNHVKTKLYHISVDKKVPGHPFFGRGCTKGYTINGFNGRPIKLKRETKYTFYINTPGNPFYFTTNSRGQGQEPLEVGGFFKPQEEGEFSIYLSKEAHKKLRKLNKSGQVYYQCSTQPQMGGLVHFIKGH